MRSSVILLFLPFLSASVTGELQHEENGNVTLGNPRFARAANPAHNCPQRPVRTRTDSSGDEYAVCALIYDRINCNGVPSAIPVNWALTDLSENGDTSRGDNWNWDNKIASLMINPHCSMQLCTDPDLSGHCYRVDGGNGPGGQNYISLDSVRGVSSLSCQCTAQAAPASSCPASARARSSTNERVCARIYDRTNCNGNGNWIAPSATFPDLSTVAMTSRNNWNWDNEIQSLEINPDCAIKLFSDTNFGGMGHTFHGVVAKNIHDLGFMKRRASSLICVCP